MNQYPNSSFSPLPAKGLAQARPFVVAAKSFPSVKEMESFPSNLLISPAPAPADCRFRLAAEKDLGPLYTTFFFRRRFVEFRTYFQTQLQRQEKGRSCWLLVESATLIVGSGQCITYPQGAELANLSVMPDHQNRGIGSAMIQLLIGFARHFGRTDIEIGVSAGNKRALNLYCRLGFEVDRALHLNDAPPAFILRKQI